MRPVVLLLASLLCSASYADSVFTDNEVRISFRYPETWSERSPQLHTTVVLLFADDGSDATCNVAASRISQLDGLSEQQLIKLRGENHGREWFVAQIEGKSPFVNLTVNKYWRGVLGQREAGFIETEYDLFVSEERIRYTSLSGATFADGKRYVLTCNSPEYGIKSAAMAFDYIRNTMIFSY